MDRLLSRLAAILALATVAVLFGAAAVAFMGISLHAALLDHMSPPLAALVTAAVLLLVALIIVLAGLAFRPARAPAVGAAQPAGSLSMEVGDELGRQVRAFVHQHSTGTAIASLAAGFALGFSPKLRQSLGDLLKK